MNEALDFIIARDIPNALARASAEHRGPVDHHWYEPRWNTSLQKIVRVIRSGETNLARLINSNIMGASRDGRNEMQECIWLGKVIRANPLVMGMQRRTVFNSVLHGECTPETDTIVELGAGNGVNLIAFWLAGGPLDATYQAFEITSTGRLCAELLGKLEPTLYVTAHPFDFYTPNYDALPKRSRHTLVFTSGSIEQISKLPKKAIADLLDKADGVSGVHFEPVGCRSPVAEIRTSPLRTWIAA